MYPCPSPYASRISWNSSQQINCHIWAVMSMQCFRTFSHRAVSSLEIGFSVESGQLSAPIHFTCMPHCCAIKGLIPMSLRQSMAICDGNAIFPPPPSSLPLPRFPLVDSRSPFSKRNNKTLAHAILDVSNVDNFPVSFFPSFYPRRRAKANLKWLQWDYVHFSPCSIVSILTRSQQSLNTSDSSHRTRTLQTTGRDDWLYFNVQRSIRDTIFVKAASHSCHRQHNILWAWRITTIDSECVWVSEWVYDCCRISEKLNTYFSTFFMNQFSLYTIFVLPLPSSPSSRPARRK